MRADGRIVSAPLEMAHSRLVETLCQRWRVPPSVVLQENASILRMVAISELSNKDVFKDADN